MRASIDSAPVGIVMDIYETKCFKTHFTFFSAAQRRPVSVTRGGKNRPYQLKCENIGIMQMQVLKLSVTVSL